MPAQIKKQLRNLKKGLVEIKSVYPFGFYARGEARPPDHGRTGIGVLSMGGGI
jgi:hypothetical protein